MAAPVQQAGGQEGQGGHGLQTEREQRIKVSDTLTLAIQTAEVKGIGITF